MSIDYKKIPGYPDCNNSGYKPDDDYEGEYISNGEGTGEIDPNNPCIGCEKSDSYECYQCAESLPGAWYQRAWQILRSRIDNDFVDPTIRRNFKKMMHEALKEAKS